MNTFVCVGVAADCYNLEDSYGEICVRCNCCGRFDIKTMWECRLKHNQEMQAENREFDRLDDNPEMRKIQEENIKANEAYYAAKIAECEKEIAKDGTKIPATDINVPTTNGADGKESEAGE